MPHRLEHRAWLTERGAHRSRRPDEVRGVRRHHAHHVAVVVRDLDSHGLAELRREPLTQQIGARSGACSTERRWNDERQ